MTTVTERNHLPYIMPSQAQKHVTYNATIQQLDITQNLSFLNRSQSAPPASPSSGDCYIVSTTPSGAFSNHAGAIAAYLDRHWQFFPTFSGMVGFDQMEQAPFIFDGNDWSPLSSTNVVQSPVLGINTTADDLNKLAVKSDAILFSTDEQSANPTGDCRLNINKTASGDTASLIFQTQYNAHAEMGLTGDDHFRIKVSPDGSTFQTALQIDTQTGFVGIGKSPSQLLDIAHTVDGISRINVTNHSAVPFAGTAIDLVAANGKYLTLLQYNVDTAYLLSSSSTLIYQLTGNAAQHRFFLGSTEALRITENGVTINAALKLSPHPQTALPSASTSGAGAIICVDDGSGDFKLAYSNGTAWQAISSTPL